MWDAAPPLLRLQQCYALVGVGYNVASAARVALYGAPLAPTQPWQGAALCTVYGCLVTFAHDEEAGAGWTLAAAGVSGVLVAGGVLKHLKAYERDSVREQYSSAAAHRAAIAINAVGGVLNACWLGGPALGAVCGAALLRRTRQAVNTGRRTDKPWWNAATHPAAAGAAASRKWRTHSVYIPMRDGVELAVDVYLPHAPAAEDSYPTIVHFTRYNRNWAVRGGRWNPLYWVYGAAMNMRSLRYVELFVPNGYAWVTCDVRGTGASGGTRYIDMAPEETADFQEVLAWALRQPFCNGAVGSMGISYDGMCAVELAAGGHPAVRAIAPVFFPVDLYDDIGCPGGMFCHGFVEAYNKFTSGLERNTPALFRDVLSTAWKATFALLDGPWPVNGDTAALARHVAAHEKNYDLLTTLRPSAAGRDFVIPRADGKTATSTDLGPVAAMEKLAASGSANNLAVYCMASYYDTASGWSALKFVDALARAGVRTKLTLGPWTHGCRRNSSPFATNSWPVFDLYRELLRFFDGEMKPGGPSVVSTEPTVHYWKLGAEEWCSHDPAADAGAPGYCFSDMEFAPAPDRLLYLNAAKTLTASAPADAGVAEHDPSPHTTTGRVSRWNLVSHILMQSVTYEPVENAVRAPGRGGYLVFTAAAPEERGWTLCGVPRLALDIEVGPAGCVDTPVFVYLAVSMTGEVNDMKVITEGCLLGSHRKKTFLVADRARMQGVCRLAVDLQPVCAAVPAGAVVSLLLAAADTDNFSPAPYGPTTAPHWKVHCGPGRSSLRLPVQQG
eukprot:TRINITY_DN5439_c0_g1_i1.p1 TRINITY_DN5439_c0_g1~~TRINITY_DN5439_c0_g1_i1.p1  ORF type:complete len:784 (+),score=209.06 TRINITY_DN5439_c0_g1_i1:1744-4095(+)